MPDKLDFVFGLSALAGTLGAGVALYAAHRRSLQVARKIREYEAHLHRLNRMLLNDPGDAAAVWEKGHLYEAMGRQAQALHCYRIAHRMSSRTYTSGDYLEACERVHKRGAKTNLRYETQSRLISRH